MHSKQSFCGLRSQTEFGNEGRPDGRMPSEESVRNGDCRAPWKDILLEGRSCWQTARGGGTMRCLSPISGRSFTVHLPESVAVSHEKGRNVGIEASR